MVTIRLANGCMIESGCSDEHDPAALPSGDWLSLSDKAGNQLLYIEIADIAHDRLALRAGLNRFLLTAAMSRGS